MGNRSLGRQFGVWHGNQGTLFNQQEHERLAADRKIPQKDRYQKGYTPERMRDVKNALGGGGKRDWRGLLYTGHGGASSPFSKGEQEHSFYDRQGRARLTETIARSKIPLDALSKKTPTIWVKPQDSASGTSGSYQQRGPGAMSDTPAVVLRGREVDTSWEDMRVEHGFPDVSRRAKKVSRQTVFERQNDEQTLIHELGHHQSNVSDTWHSQSYADRPGSRGAEEAYADDFKDVHWRPDPRDASKRGGWDPRPAHAYDAMGRKPEDPYAKHPAEHGIFARSYGIHRKNRPEYTPRVGKEEEPPNTLFVDNPDDRWSPASHKRLRPNPNIGRQF
jgi:hypothetical protein